MGSLDYTFANNNPYRVVFYTYIDSAKIPESYDIAPNATSTKFTSVSYSKSWTPGDFSIFNNHKTYFTTDGTNSTNPVVFKQSLQGVILYYELETEEVIDISNMID